MALERHEPYDSRPTSLASRGDSGKGHCESDTYDRKRRDGVAENGVRRYAKPLSSRENAREVSAFRTDQHDVL